MTSQGHLLHKYMTNLFGVPKKFIFLRNLKIQNTFQWNDFFNYFFLQTELVSGTTGTLLKIIFKRLKCNKLRN